MFKELCKKHCNRRIFKFFNISDFCEMHKNYVEFKLCWVKDGKRYKMMVDVKRARAIFQENGLIWTWRYVTKQKQDCQIEICVKDTVKLEEMIKFDCGEGCVWVDHVDCPYSLERVIV